MVKNFDNQVIKLNNKIVIEKMKSKRLELINKDSEVIT